MKREGELIVTWKVDGDKSAEIHLDGHEDLPDEIRAMVAGNLIGQLAHDGKLLISVHTL